MSEEKREILIITGAAVKYTGKVSFKFMIDADPDRKLQHMPQKWGCIWRPNVSENAYAFNVFEGGQGLVVGGGWTEHDDLKWEKEMLDAIPSCTLLMDVDYLPWWKALTEKHGVDFKHHHFDGILTTS